jgi:hypothetical protein
VPGSPDIRRLILLGPSLLLTLLMFFHPSPYHHVEHELIPIATWWTVLYTLQFLLFAAMGASLWMLLAGLRGYTATTARIAAVIFARFCDIGEAVAGIATGLLASNAAGGDFPEPVAVTAINPSSPTPPKTYSSASVSSPGSWSSLHPQPPYGSPAPPAYLSSRSPSQHSY